MIKRIAITYLLLIAAFYAAVKLGYVSYGTNTDNSYFVKAERYTYTDTINKNSVVMVGSSLSNPYKVNNTAGSFINLSMTGRSATDGLDVIMASKKLPGTVLIEENIFDNPTDSTITDKLFFPVFGKLRQKFFFLQKRYKLHNLLSNKFYDPSSRVLGVMAKYTGLYSQQQNNLIKKSGIDANTLQKEDFIRNKNVTYHSTLNNQDGINAKAALLERQIQYLQQNGVRVVLFKTPVIGSIYNSERTQYKDSIINSMANRLSIPMLLVNNNEEYQPYLVAGDGIHMNISGHRKYQAFLDSTLVIK